MARWRQPVVIWLRRAQKNRYWNRKRKRTVDDKRRVPWSSAALYAAALLAAAGVLWKVPPKSSDIPVSARLVVPSKPSWIDRTLSNWNVPAATFRGWLNQGVPLLGLVMDSYNFEVHLNALVATGVRAITGIQLTSLDSLITVDIPALSVVHYPVAAPVTNKPTKQVRPKAQDAVDASLPGDGGRVWAELGQDPLVGIYQTHSHESFWSELPSGSATAYSRDWSKTIVQVGWWLAVDLHDTGTPVVQSRVDNMSEGLLASYNKSYYTAKQLIKWYPSVRMLLDLHRGSSAVAPAAIQGNKVAKILIVVGTNKLLPNEYWHQNLEVALRLSKVLQEVAPGILEGKGIETVPYRYNQQLMAADLMVEVGGPNSTMAEERYAVHDLAEAITELIRKRGLPAQS